MSFDDHRAFYIIGSDGGLLERSNKVNLLRLAPAERVEILLYVADGKTPTLKYNVNQVSSGIGVGMNRIDEVVKAGRVEIWTIENHSMMAHSFHIHNVQFKIIFSSSGIQGHKLGYKDVVLVHPDEQVKVLIKAP